MRAEEFEIILDHYRHPRNFGELPEADARARLTNQLCGDIVEIFMRIEDDKIAEVKFRGRGCALSQASASMLTEKLKGMSLKEAMSLDEQDIMRMLRVKVGPTRRGCALLPLNALKKALEYYMKRRG